MPDYIYAYQGKFIAPSSGKVIGKQVVDPYNPLGLSTYTMRLKFAEGYDPSVSIPTSDWTLVDSTENIWDGRNYEGMNQFPRVMSNTYLLECISANMRTSSGFNTSFRNRFNGCSSLVSVSLPCTDCVTRMDSMFRGCTSLTSIPETLDTSGCERMDSMFQGCTSLTSIPATLDTSVCTNMNSMFRGCTSLTSIPATLDTSVCTNMTRMFQDCVNVQSGALAFYQQASTQTTPPSTHTGTFLNCGSNTVTGAAELAQIPTSWGGTMA